MLKKIMEIYETINYVEDCKNNIQPTFLYNEGWILRLILKWFNEKTELDHELSMEKQAKWYSEALLSSKFFPKPRGDNLAESYTHVDGVYGDFIIGNKGESDLSLKENCRQFVVVEAKMFSKFSEGTKNASKYNQAARIIACMCNVVVDSKQYPENISFFTIIPKKQKDKEFEKYLNIEHVKLTVLDRVNQYNKHEDYEDKQSWYNNHFLPFCDKIKIKLFFWEDIIDYICLKDQLYGNELKTFYESCIKYNTPDP
jgi:hypothetical protein